MTENHLQNAVRHYRQLQTQGLAPDKALSHTSQRFGIPQSIVWDRVSGKVADPEKVRDLLSRIRSRRAPERQRDAVWMLDELYEAITGEVLDD